jgi:hypothetical protein
MEALNLSICEADLNFMVHRPSRVYWITKPDGKHILVFDRGHEMGSVYVYELRESFTVDQVKDEYRRYINPTNPNVVNADTVDSVMI